MIGSNPEWLPLVGVVDVIVAEAVAIAIHGDVYIDLMAAPEGRAPVAMRVAGHHLPAPPPVGTRLRVHLLMSQIDRVEILDPG